MAAAAEGTTFGEYLKYLRRRARLTQRDLGVQVGYSTGQICMLENGQRKPDATSLAALFVPALGIERDEKLTARLFDLARDRDEASSVRASPAAKRPIARRQELGTLEDTPALPTPFVPRTAQEALSAALRQNPIVLLVGLPGMGKTTLAAWQARKNLGPVLWITLSAGINNTLDAVLGELALFAFVHSPNKLRATPLVPDASTQPLSLDQRLARISAELRDFQQPPLVVLDNAHTLAEDAATWSALAHCLGRAPDARLLLTSREQFAFKPTHQVVPLDGLTLDEAVALAAALKSPMAGTELEQLHNRTAGNPLLLRLGLGAGALREGHASGDAMNDALDGLAAPATRLLELLCVLRAPLDASRPAVATTLEKAFRRYAHAAAVDQLQRRRLIDAAGRAHAHGLIRQHVLNELALRPASQQAVHKTAARLMEQMDNPVECAHHWCAAGELQKASDVLADQHDRFIAAGVASEAAGVAEEVLRSAQPLRGPQRNAIVRQMRVLRGDLLINTLRSTEAMSDYRAALDVAEGGSVRAQVAQKLAGSLLQRGQSDEALSLCAGSLELLGSDANAETAYLRAQLEVTQATALMQLSRHAEAQEACQRVLKLSERVALFMPRLTDMLRARAHGTLGIVARFQRRHNDARLHYLKSIEFARLAQSRQFEARQLMNLGNLQLEIGDLAAAWRYYGESKPIGEALGDSWLLARLTHARACVQYFRGQIDAALADTERSIELKEQMNDLQGKSNSENFRALILTTLGRVDEARERAEHILLDTAHTGEQWLRAHYLEQLALALAVQGDGPRALATLREAMTFESLAKDVRLRHSLLTYTALAHLASGDLAAARESLTEPAPDECGVEVQLERELVTAAVALAGGDIAAARTAFQAVHRRAESSGYMLYARHAARLLQLQPADVPPRMLPREIFVMR